MKIAIVTGASSGMGRETAVQLADRFGGIQEFWLIARRRDRLSRLAEELPAPCRIFALDLAREESFEILKKALEEEKPEVKFLVNASGYGRISRVGELPLAEETGMAAVNCLALTAMVHLALPYMARNSRIIQYASAAAFLPQPGFAVYAATKAYVLSFSRALREELRWRDIYVTAVCPGPVRTEFFDIAQTTGKIPLYKLLVLAKPKKVVAKAIRDSVMGRGVSVYGIGMKAFLVIAKILPHSLLLCLLSKASPEQVTEGTDEE